MPRQTKSSQNPLRLKVGQPVADNKAESVSRALAALQKLAPEFEGWLENTLRRLDTARDGYLTDPGSSYLRRALLRRALDVKGLGSTIGYPLVTRIGGSLVRMIDLFNEDEHLPEGLLDRHIKILYAIQKAKARNADAKQFVSLAADLERDVTAIRQHLRQRKA